MSFRRIASRNHKPQVDILGAEFSTDLNSLLQDDIDIVVELIGGTDDAHALISDAIRNDLPVVTANKAVLAEHGNGYIAEAKRRRVPLGFEASVAGGIPIIATIKDGLAGNRISSVSGILNGTCNYILTAMDEQGSSFETALSEAQELGYAEADPSFDVGGIDAAQKLAILGSIAFDQPIDVENIYIEGITGVDVEDINYARELGYRVKHLATACTDDSSIEMRVHPALVSDHDLISSVDGADNAISIVANGVETLLLKGPGAGARPTASAVLSDIIEIARGKSSLPASAESGRSPRPITELECPYYLNIPVADVSGVMATLANTLGRHNISMEAVIQKPDAIRDTGSIRWVPVVVLTDTVKESVMNETIHDLQTLGTVQGPIRRIRVSQTH